MSQAKQRADRIAQAKHRGSARSYKTDAENLGLLLLWEAEVLSEGQVAKALNIDRVTLRMMREGAMAEALRLAECLLPANAELSGPRPLAVEGSRSNDVLGAVRPGKDWR